MTYLLDANVFMNAKNLHYGFDFCPAFWEWLIVANNAEKVYSIDKVADEIKAGSDELSDWADARGRGFFLPTTSRVFTSFATVSEWVSGSGRYEPSAVNIFLQAADYYLVVHAHATKYTIVTHETPSTAPKRVKIPDPCIGLEIDCITPYQMLRMERARFILGPRVGRAPHGA